jgi:hypothetical protein
VLVYGMSAVRMPRLVVEVSGVLAGGESCTCWLCWSRVGERVAGAPGGQRSFLQFAGLYEARQERFERVRLNLRDGGQLCAGGTWPLLSGSQHGLAIGAARRTLTPCGRRRLVSARSRLSWRTRRRCDSGRTVHFAQRLQRSVQAAVLVDERTQFCEAHADLFTDAVKEVRHACSLGQKGNSCILADDPVVRYRAFARLEIDARQSNLTSTSRQRQRQSGWCRLE